MWYASRDEYVYVRTLILCATRCMGMEHERDGLHARIADLSAAREAAEQAKQSLSKAIAQAGADRDEAVRYNLNLQRKLTSLESKHSELEAAYQELKREADAVRGDNSKLNQETAKLQQAVQRLGSERDTLKQEKSDVAHRCAEELRHLQSMVAAGDAAALKRG